MAAFRRLILHAVVEVSCLLMCGLQQFSGQERTLLQCTAEANSTCKQAVCLANEAIAMCCKKFTSCMHTYVVAFCTLLVCYCCSPQTNTSQDTKYSMNQLITAVAANCCSPHSTVVACWLQQQNIKCACNTIQHTRRLLTASTGHKIILRNTAVAENQKLDLQKDDKQF